MQVKSTIVLTYKDEQTAQHIQKALTVDDETFVTSTVKHNELHASIESKSLSSFQQTIDDYLSCVTIAETIVESQEKKKQ